MDNTAECIEGDAGLGQVFSANRDEGRRQVDRCRFGGMGITSAGLAFRGYSLIGNGNRGASGSVGRTYDVVMVTSTRHLVDGEVAYPTEVLLSPPRHRARIGSSRGGCRRPSYAHARQC